MGPKSLKLSRRHFFSRTTAAAVSIAGISALGFNHFSGETAEAAPLLTGKDKILADFVVLDSHYATFGKTRIEARFSNGASARRKSAIEWIVRRRHANMYDLVCQCLQDRDMEVRLYAASRLGVLPPLALKPHIDLIAEAEAACKSQDFRRQLAKLLEAAESS